MGRRVDERSPSSRRAAAPMELRVGELTSPASVKSTTANNSRTSSAKHANERTVLHVTSLWLRGSGIVVKLFVKDERIEHLVFGLLSPGRRRCASLGCAGCGACCPRTPSPTGLCHAVPQAGF